MKRPLIIMSLSLFAGLCAAQSLPLVDCDWPALSAQTDRIAETLQTAGSPLSGRQRAELAACTAETDPKMAVERLQKLLDPLCLVAVNINPESRVKIALGPAKPALKQQDWRAFLIKITNEGGVTAELRVSSPNALPKQTPGVDDPFAAMTPAEVAAHWMDVALADQPSGNKLSGFNLEYRVIRIFSRDAGKREAKLAFDVGQGTQDLGFRNEANILFDCEP